MTLSPETLARVLDLPTAPSNLPPATGIAFHSGQVRPGDAFFAFAGAATHGIRYAAEALERGAAYVVSDQPHQRGIEVPDAATALLQLGRHARDQWTAPVIGVTGSAGKTTTKEYLAAALGAGSSPGNFNTPYALATTIANAWLSGTSSRPLVLEMGIDRPGEMAVLTALVRPDAGILTLVAASHLEALGTVQNVADEKSILLASARAKFASVQAAGWLDDDLAKATIRYGLARAEAEADLVEPDVGEADVIGEILSHEQGRTRLRVGDVVIELPTLSRAAAENAVGAWAVATHLGVAPRVAAERMAEAALPPGRLQSHPWGRGLVLDDSYNSNPASAAIALDTLRRHAGPHVAVLGDMLELGAERERWHRELGDATRGLDRVLALGPESRAIVDGNPEAEHFASFDELAGALRYLPREGTVLVKASRGMRLDRAVRLLLEDAST